MEVGPLPVESQSPDPSRAPAATNASDQKPQGDPEIPAHASGSIQLTGAVTDSRGQAIGGKDGGIGLTNAAGDFRSTAIENGRYSIEGLAQGQYVLGCGLRGFESSERTVTLHADEVVHREDFALSNAWMIAVHILTPEGEDLRTRLQQESVGRGLQLTVLSTAEPPGDHLPPSFNVERSGEGVSTSKTWWAAGEERDDRIQVRVETTR
jgi:hypothetical protein